MINPSSLEGIFKKINLDHLIDVSEVTEIQRKAKLDQDTYQRLLEEFPVRYGKATSGVLVTTRYRSGPGGHGDFRLRLWYDDLTKDPSGAEIILKEHKQEGVSARTRREIKEVPNIKMYALLRRAFNQLGYHFDPPWVKLATHFFVKLGGHEYRLSLQFIEGEKKPFGPVLEGSIKLYTPITPPEEDFHIQRIDELFSTWGIEPTPEEIYNGRLVPEFISANTPHPSNHH